MKRGVAMVAAVLLAAGREAAGEPLSFRTGILPVLTKAGCNAGACHGAATGQGGFRLSLLGYDPEEDYERITRELGARRIDLEHPGESLLLRKPSEEVDHEGGRKLPRSSEGYEKVLRWLAAGAPFGPRQLQVAVIAVEPADMLLAGTEEKTALRVIATLSDGTREDVTALALYTSNDDAIASVSKTGGVTAVRPGLTSVMVRYGGQVAAARIAVPLGPEGAVEAGFPCVNFIDEHIRAELVRLRVPASPLSDDAEFLRRVHLDLTGRLPEPETARAFLAEPASSEKRVRVINELLACEAFTDFWTMKLADLLLLGGKGDGAAAYHEWLRSQIAANTPLDQLVSTLLTASGDLSSTGPANFFTLAADPRDLSEHVGRMFLGAQIACARCHAHPSDRWTQEDYHRFAAYFARLSWDGGALKAVDRGEVEHPKTGRPLAPKPLGGLAPPRAEAGDRRVGLAEWLTARDNPYFACSLANRVWRHLLGRGLVEPVDDVRPTNPPTHPGLLDALAAELVAHRFDLRHLVRTIASSRTYQLTSRALDINRSDRQLYSHAYLKPLEAPVFADAVAQVTGVPDAFEHHAAGTRAVQLIGPSVPSPALDVLGRCQRKAPCDSPARAGGGLAQALHLINGPTINGKLRGGIIAALEQKAAREAVEELYVRAFTRPPDPDELADWQAGLSRAGDRPAALQDLLWTLLNSREFSCNH